MVHNFIHQRRQKRFLFADGQERSHRREEQDGDVGDEDNGHIEQNVDVEKV